MIIKKVLSTVIAAFISITFVPANALSADEGNKIISRNSTADTIVKDSYFEEVVSYPTKKVYNAGEKLDVSGLKIITNDNEIHKVAAYDLEDFDYNEFDITDKNGNKVSINKFDTLPAGEYTVSYNGSIRYRYTHSDVVIHDVIFSYPVTVKEAPDNSVSVTYTTPTNTTTSATAPKPITTTTTAAMIPLSVKEDKITLTNGDQYTIKANRSDVSYKSNNKSVAVVSAKGIITAIGEGTAIISIIGSDSDVVQIKVTVDPVPTATTITQPLNYNLGDVDNNGIVDAVDASRVLSEYARVSSNMNSSFSETQRKAADSNKDGFIDAVDASKILAFYAYKSTNGTLGFEEYIKDRPITTTKAATTTTTTAATTTTTTTTTTRTTTTSTAATATTTTTITPIDGTIYAKQGLVVKYKGMGEENGDTLIYVYIENNTNKKIAVQVRDSSINGYMIRPIFSSEIEAGRKLNDYLYFDKDELKNNGIAQIKNVEWKFIIFSWDHEFNDWYTDVIRINL